MRSFILTLGVLNALVILIHEKALLHNMASYKISDFSDLGSFTQRSIREDTLELCKDRWNQWCDELYLDGCVGETMM
jgi:hypothetical protein